MLQNFRKKGGVWIVEESQTKTLSISSLKFFLWKSQTSQIQAIAGIEYDKVAKLVSSWWKTSSFLSHLPHLQGSLHISSKIWGMKLFSFRGLDIYRKDSRLHLFWGDNARQSILYKKKKGKKNSICKVVFVFVFSIEVWGARSEWW